MSDDIKVGVSLEFSDATINQYQKLTKQTQTFARGVEIVNNHYRNTENLITQIVTKTQKMADGSIKVSEVVKTINNIEKNRNKELEQQVKNIKAAQSEYARLLNIINKPQASGQNRQNQINMYEKMFDSLKKGPGALDRMTTSLTHNLQKMAEWAIAGTALYGTLRLIQSAFQDMVKIEAGLINIAKVLDPSVSLKELADGAVILSKEFGQSVIETESAMQQWARQFKDVDDIMVMTRASLLATTATDISFADSVKALSAITAEWNLTTKDSIHIVDVLNQLSNMYRVSATELSVGLSKSGSAARVSGQQFEELAGIITVGVQALGLSGEELGTMWTRVMARMKGNIKAKELFADMGIDSMKPLSDVMTELSSKWVLMTQVEKTNFAITVAGTHHWSKFVGIMDNYDTVLKATIDSYFSYNSAQNEVNRVMDSMQKKLGVLQATWQGYLATNISLLNTGKGIVGFLTAVVNGLNQIPAPVILATTALLGLTIAIRSAVLAGTSLSAFLLSPWGIAIMGLTVIVGLLATVGANAKSAAQNIAEMQNRVAASSDALEGKLNAVKGVDYLIKQYKALTDGIDKAKASGQDFEKLQNRLTIVQNKLIDLIAKGDQKRAESLRKKASLEGDAKKALQLLVDEYNAEGKIYQQKLIMQNQIQTAKLTGHLQTMEMLKDELKQVIKFQGIKDILLNNPFMKAMPILREFMKIGSAGLEKTLGLNLSDSYKNEITKRIKDYNQQNALLNKNFKPITLDQILSNENGDPTKWGESDDNGGGSTSAYHEKLQKRLDLETDFKAKIAAIDQSILDNRNEFLMKLASAEEKTLSPALQDKNNLTEFFAKQDKDYVKQIADTTKQLELASNEQKAVYQRIAENNNILSGDSKYAKAQEENKDLLLYVNKIEIGIDGLTDALKRLQVAQKGNLASGDFWKNILGINATEIQSAYSNIEKIQKEIEAAKAKMGDSYSGSSKEYGLNDQLKKANLAYWDELVKKVAILDDLLNKNPQWDESVKKEIKLLVDWINESKQPPVVNPTIRSINSEDIGKTFKEILKGTKSLKEAFLDMFSSIFNETKNNVVDKFINNITASLDPNAKGLGGKFKSLSESISKTWKEMEGAEKGMLVAAAASSLLRANPHKGAQAAATGIEVGGSVGGGWGALIGGIIGSFVREKAPSKSMGSEIGKFSSLVNEYNAGGQKWKKYWWSSAQRDLEATIKKLSAFLATSVDDLANSIQNAFNQDTYFGFLNSWTTSLESMTRSALVKAFIGSEAYQGLYKSLSETITKSVMDGNITADEMLLIKQQGQGIADLMRQLYPALQMIDGMYPDSGGSSGGSTSYSAGSAIPITITNYVNIYGTYFGEDEDGLREFGLMIGDIISEESARA